MYYWDGQRWASTLSPDHRFRWNGTTWEPVPPPIYTPAFAPPAQREATSWTQPLQIAVIVRYVLAGAYGLMLPFLMGRYMSQVMQQSIQRQQEALPPGATPPPAAFTAMMTSMMTGSLWAGAMLGVALSVIAIVAALKRWVWAYYVILVLIGFTLAGSVFNLINLAVGGALTAAEPQPPVLTRIVAYVFTPIDVLLFVWMLIALIRRGPWAMRRISY
ncbi:MAG TPA: hypothetical protein VFR33_09730 [Candidatus Dormibacteraeota bacterium]|nr:hypothetical protein [Candidatus Dormibacteraeota bacterium]